MSSPRPATNKAPYEGQKTGSKMAIPMIACLWAGLTLGVSFIATPAKFLAPSLSMPDALEVGRATFNSLKWVELTLAFVLLSLLLRNFNRKQIIIFSVVAALLVLQYTQLLPILDLRVEQIVQGEQPEKSSLHLVYASLEFLKIGLIAGIGYVALQHPRASFKEGT